MEPHVKILREFRDRFLLGNNIGKAFEVDLLDGDPRQLTRQIMDKFCRRAPIIKRFRFDRQRPNTGSENHALQDLR